MFQMELKKEIESSREAQKKENEKLKKIMKDILSHVDKNKH